MEYEDSDDELPPISVTSLSQDSSARSLVMPSAGEVAAERAREQHTELELRRLRELHEDGAGDAPARSDSSGSEGEAALAQAVRALRVLPPGAAPPPADHLAHARALLGSLPAPTPSAMRHLATALDCQADPVALKRLIDRVVLALSSLAACSSNSWSEEELVSGAGLACVACLAARGPAPRRLLHRLLRAAGGGAVHRLAALAAAAGAAAAGAAAAGAAAAPGAGGGLLLLADAAHGGPAQAELLAALLVRHALTALLREPEALGDGGGPLSGAELGALLERGAWRLLPPRARLAALRLAARALRGAGGGRAAAGGAGDGGAARALAALQQAPPPHERHHPDYLKVAVATSTLQLLFRARP